MGLKVLIIVIAIWALIQSAGYLALSIMAYLAHDCEYDMNRNPFVYLIYLIYFRDRACGDIVWENLGITIPGNPQPTVPDVADIASRTNTLAILYIASSSAWAFTSLVILVGACARCCGKIGYYLMYVPWILVATATIALDIQATIYFINDFTDSRTATGLLRLLEVAEVEIFSEFLDQVTDVTFSIPAVLFFLTSSRLFIILLLNIASVIVVGRYGYKLQTQNRSVGRGHMHGQSNAVYETEPYPPQDNPQKRILPIVHVQPQPQPYQETIDPVASRYVDSSKQSNLDVNAPYVYNDSSSLNARNRNGPNDSLNSGAQNIPPMVLVKTDPNSRANENNNESGVRRTVEPLKGIEDNLSERSSISKEPAELRNAQVPVVVHSESDSGNEAPVKKQPPPVPKKPPTNRFTYLPPNEEVYKAQLANLRDSQGGEVRRDSGNTKQPEELRSQLPWSYFKGRGDSQTPKKSNDIESYDEDDLLPPVPVPDYTMHFPKTKRPGLEDTGTQSNSTSTPATTTTNTTPSSDEGKWSGPEFQY